MPGLRPAGNQTSSSTSNISNTTNTTNTSTTTTASSTNNVNISSIPQLFMRNEWLHVLLRTPTLKLQSILAQMSTKNLESASKIIYSLKQISTTFKDTNESSRRLVINEFLKTIGIYVTGWLWSTEEQIPSKKNAPALEVRSMDKKVALWETNGPVDYCFVSDQNTFKSKLIIEAKFDDLEQGLAQAISQSMSGLREDKG